MLFMRNENVLEPIFNIICLPLDLFFGVLNHVMSNLAEGLIALFFLPFLLISRGGQFIANLFIIKNLRDINRKL